MNVRLADFAEVCVIFDIYLFIYCNWVSTRWLCSANLYKIGKRQLYTKGETILKTIRNHRIHKIENKYTKQRNKHKRSIKKHKVSN